MNVEVDLRDARKLFETYSPLIDLVDALQIISMKKGYYKLLAGESQPVLVTDDKKLAKVAEAENLKVRII